jgi:GMP synthase (glutamine-hydrolysing)
MDRHIHPRSIVILDCGGQYAHLIGRRVRECGAYSEILPPETPAEALKHAAGIILSGGPQSVYEPGSPQADPKILELGIPVLGLCYGLHWMAQTLGGKVTPGKVKEYGRTPITITKKDGLLRDCGDKCVVWMSHGDEATTLPQGFQVIAASEDCAHAAFADESRQLFALQFHPEVTHSEHGFDILKRFVGLCDAAPWSMHGFLERIQKQVAAKVGDRKVFLLVSGGVDSAVCFALLNRVLGPERVQGLMVDTGLMRKGEVEGIRKAFHALKFDNLRIEDASAEFFKALEGVTEPEAKRQAIGDTFLAVQRRVAEEMKLTPEAGYMLGQGTIYPDTIETGGTKHADKIKTHHNRVEAIQTMIEQGLVIEPLEELYKDEVRALGEQLGLPHEMVWRHPFPGPGLGVRILCADAPDEAPVPDTASVIRVPHAALPVKSVGVQGDGRTYRKALSLFSEQPCYPTTEHLELATRVPNAVHAFNRVLLCTSHASPPAFHFTPGFLTRERADLLREADRIVDEEMRKALLHEKIWQFPVVLLPFGARDGHQSVVLRPVESTEAMTANAMILPGDVLERITRRLLGIAGIDMVFLDLTAKPPATIEWE